LENWSHFVITPDKEFETRFGRKADKKRKLFNGQIECTYYQYFGPLPPR
jgi:putative N6-adenine-specific DNA methylase